MSIPLFRQIVTADSLCFDVGANVGDKTAALLEAGAGSVVAVEPQAHCAEALRARFADEPVEIVECGLGSTAGEADLYPSAIDTMSSFSPPWVEAATAAGRFAGNRWHGPVRVPIRTLDSLIHEYGVPRFCKVDVEGYEEEVLGGLTRPGTGVLSFEFTPEALGTAQRCIDMLERLGFDRFTFAYAEEGVFRLPWVSAEDVTGYLAASPSDGVFFGDVYAASLAAGPLS
jgi:FkbM family methyltransferase